MRVEFLWVRTMWIAKRSETRTFAVAVLPAVVVVSEKNVHRQRYTNVGGEEDHHGHRLLCQELILACLVEENLIN